NDTTDNDDDAMVDCFDTDCLNQSCGTGCTCGAAGVKRETTCNDDRDNDGDGMKDCADSDCVNEVCTPTPLFFRCTARRTCSSNGGPEFLEVNALCRDGIDNDCNGKSACAEMSCNGQMCIMDGGMGSCASLMCMP